MALKKLHVLFESLKCNPQNEHSQSRCSLGIFVQLKSSGPWISPWHQNDHTVDCTLATFLKFHESWQKHRWEPNVREWPVCGLIVWPSGNLHNDGVTPTSLKQTGNSKPNTCNVQSWWCSLGKPSHLHPSSSILSTSPLKVRLFINRVQNLGLDLPQLIITMRDENDKLATTVYIYIYMHIPV